MSKDKIEINGEWYVKESTLTKGKKPHIDITSSLEITHESKNWCFTAWVLLKDGATSIDDHYSDPSITITDKRPDKREDWVVMDNINNSLWVLDTLDNGTEAEKDFMAVYKCHKGLEEYREFINVLINKKWFSIDE